MRPRSVLASLALALAAFASAQDLPRFLPARARVPGDATQLDSVRVPGTGFDVGLAVCAEEIVVLRGGRLHRLPRGSEQWEELAPMPAGTVAIAGHERELWAVDTRGFVTVLDPVKGTAIRQVRLPALPTDRVGTLEIRSIGVSKDNVVVCAVGEPGKGAVKRAKSILRLDREREVATWLEVLGRDGEADSVGVDASTGGVVVAQSDCAVWLDPRGAPARAALWMGRASAFALDGAEGLVLVAERAPDGKEHPVSLRRLRLLPLPCVRVDIAREGALPTEGADTRLRGSVRWTVDGARCDTRPEFLAALDRIGGGGDEGPVVLVSVGKRVVYRDVAETLADLKPRKLRAAFW